MVPRVIFLALAKLQFDFHVSQRVVVHLFLAATVAWLGPELVVSLFQNLSRSIGFLQFLDKFRAKTVLLTECVRFEVLE